MAMSYTRVYVCVLVCVSVCVSVTIVRTGQIVAKIKNVKNDFYSF